VLVSNHPKVSSFSSVIWIQCPTAIHESRWRLWNPTGVLLYGPPGTGKTLLARAVAATLDTNFLKVVSSAIVDKYIGESARLIREMFAYAKEHEPCIIFMDEIDAIGGRRFSEGTSADREIQRTLMEVSSSIFQTVWFSPDYSGSFWQLLNQLDGFDYLGKTKVIFATNRPDTLDPALLRPGRVDRKIEIPLPNEVARMEIMKIHAAPIRKSGEIDYEAVVKLSEGFNGAGRFCATLPLWPGVEPNLSFL
jgi:26S proteasome regulatory subunit T4